jgi:hypothetical protein
LTTTSRGQRHEHWFYHRERLLATLAGELLDYVPAWPQGFPNAATIRRVMPPELLLDDLARFPETGAYGFGPHHEQELDRLMEFNRPIDQAAVGVGRGANCSFGHGGPGEPVVIVRRDQEIS